jgi:hypothetical protein
VLEEDEPSPFAPIEALVDSSCSSEDEDFGSKDHDTPLRVRADGLRLSGPTQEALWQLHTKDPDRFTVNRLAGLFELKPWKVADTIELKEDEKRAMEAGEETTNLEAWFVQDMFEYDYGKGDLMEIPYTSWMFGGKHVVTEKMDHRTVDEIDIEKYREYDAERIEFMKKRFKPAKDVYEFASQIVPGKPLDVEKRAKARYDYVFTDLTEKKKDLFKVYVRDAEGGMRNATAAERLRAVREERPHPNQYRKML